MRRKQLRKSEIKEFNEEISFYKNHIKISKNDLIEIVDETFIFLNHKQAFFYYNSVPVPTLRFLLGNDILKEIIVDMGAVKFVSSGADVMLPGIVSFGDFRKDEFVVIKDVVNRKPIAVGLTILSSDEIKASANENPKGKVIKNIHYIGDKIWNFNP